MPFGSFSSLLCLIILWRCWKLSSWKKTPLYQQICLILSVLLSVSAIWHSKTDSLYAWRVDQLHGLVDLQEGVVTWRETQERNVDIASIIIVKRNVLTATPPSGLDHLIKDKQTNVCVGGGGWLWLSVRAAVSNVAVISGQKCNGPAH